MAAPSRPDMLSVWLNQRLAAGDASRTIGFNFELSSTPDIIFSAGKTGKSLRSSRPDKAAPTASGAGAQESDMLSTMRMVDRNPLMIISVNRYADQLCRKRGV